ncbi:energy-coupling factor ABC transporter permease [Tessaracoccus sp. G1721]
MHIAEGMLPPLHCAAWLAASTPFVIHGARAVLTTVREHPERKLILAAAGAFTLVVSAMKLPSITGSSSHPTGTGLGAVLLKPPVMAFLGTLVLLFQATLLAHGGLTTLGANAFSMAVVGPWAAYGAYRATSRLSAPLWLSMFVAMAVANIVTYAVTSFQLALAYPDPVSGLGGALVKFLTLFAVTQIPLAVAEGLLGVLLVGFLTRAAHPVLSGLGLLRGDVRV